MSYFHIARQPQQAMGECTADHTGSSDCFQKNSTYVQGKEQGKEPGLRLNRSF